MSAEHPTPWRRVRFSWTETGEPRYEFLDANGVVVDTEEERQADTIIRAVNAHETLLHALIQADAAFLWMETQGIPIEDGGINAVAYVRDALKLVDV